MFIFNWFKSFFTDFFSTTPGEGVVPISNDNLPLTVVEYVYMGDGTVEAVTMTYEEAQEYIKILGAGQYLLHHLTHRMHSLVLIHMTLMFLFMCGQAIHVEVLVILVVHLHLVIEGKLWKRFCLKCILAVIVCRLLKTFQLP